mmetsp:Transcript_47531/g.103470  ORF Transcript_47531/g.103470 Transcript_47531/m.103470 type:complete len:225 (+) Transcript_47531:74-748(+)
MHSWHPGPAPGRRAKGPDRCARRLPSPPCAPAPAPIPRSALARDARSAGSGAGGWPLARAAPQAPRPRRGPPRPGRTPPGAGRCPRGRPSRSEAGGTRPRRPSVRNGGTSPEADRQALSFGRWSPAPAWRASWAVEATASQLQTSTPNPAGQAPEPPPCQPTPGRGSWGTPRSPQPDGSGCRPVPRSPPPLVRAQSAPHTWRPQGPARSPPGATLPPSGQSRGP